VWYEQNGLADEAIEHGLRSEDFERVADMIEEYVDHVLHFGERSKLRRWLDEIPVAVTFAKPYLCILHAGNSYISGHIDEAERHLQAAEQALEPGNSNESDAKPMKTDPQLAPGTVRLRGRAATVRSFLVSYQGDVEKSIQYARQALMLLPTNDLTWRCSAIDNLGTAYSTIGDTALAYEARLEALQVSKAAGNVYMMLFASLRLVVTLRDLGRLQQAIALCQQQSRLADESGLSQTALVGWLYTLWGEMLAERNELDQAVQLATKGVELTERGKDVVLLGSSYLCLMRVLFSKGDMESAKEIIEEVNDITLRQDLSPWITNQLAAWQARIWLAEEKLDAAHHWAEECELDVDGELSSLHDFDYAVLARILIAQGRLDEAAKLLQSLLKAADAGGRISKVIEVRILQALTFQARGEPDQALCALESALNLAEPESFVRIFVDEGQPMARLLHEAFNRGIAPEYVRRMLAAISSDEPLQACTATFQTDLFGLIEPLSDRELEVLQRIAEGLTNREIADRLYLSLNTVKVHTRNIYGKLGVKSRTQAVARARELAVLPTF
jgi:LuxR family maltose regulon positive regulatory protein